MKESESTGSILAFPTFTVITSGNCVWCVMAKRVLNNLNMKFTEVVVPHDMPKDEFISLTERYATQPTVPKVFVGEKLIGGYDDLLKYLNSKHDDEIEEDETL